MTQPRYTPLCEASVDQLLDELKSRNECVVVGLFDPKTATRAGFDLSWSGDLAWCTLIHKALGRAIDRHVDRHIAQRHFYGESGEGA